MQNNLDFIHELQMQLAIVLTVSTKQARHSGTFQKPQIAHTTLYSRRSPKLVLRRHVKNCFHARTNILIYMLVAFTLIVSATRCFRKRRSSNENTWCYF